MADGISGLPVFHQDIDQVVEKATAAEKKVEAAAEQVASDKTILQANEEANPGRPPSTTKEQKKIRETRVKKAMAAGDSKGQKITPVQEKTAFDFQQNNPELKASILLRLRSVIDPKDSPEEILEKVRTHFGDVSNADEALDFLLLTTEGELHNKVKQAKAQFNELKGREITAGRNIAKEARAAEQERLGTATNMRDMYRDVTGNPRDVNTLFNELSQKYSFKSLVKVTQFLLHSMGADMNAKGPSIPRGELHNFMTEIRTIQAILGVYRFFNGRMPLVRRMMAKENLL